MIQFAAEDTDFKLDLPTETADWLMLLAQHHGYTVLELNYVFCSDEHLLYLNQKYLQHDEYTDILTFDYSEKKSKKIVGDIFISIDRVRDNAQQLGQAFVDELHRVMAHGLLHLVGFDDSTDDLQAIMRQQEDFALNLRMF
jgi:rRNA maturation RNase YbeY